MYYFLEIACVISEIWMINWLLNGMFPSRDLPNYVRSVLYVCYCIVLTVLSFIHELPFLRITLNLGIICILGMVLFKVNLIRSFFASVVICALAAFADVLVSSLLLHLGYTMDELMVTGPQRSLYLIATHISLFAFSACVYAVFFKRKETISIKLLLLVLPCWLCGALLCLIYTQQLLDEKSTSPLYQLVLLGMLYTDILFVYQINQLSIREREKQEGKLAEQHYAMQQAYYDQFRIQQEETRALWHDISKLLRAAKLDSNSEELEQLEHMLHSIGHVVDVDNRVISVILNEYVQEATQEEIRLDLDIQVPRELPVSASDLYILLGNTLDNAIEACFSLPHEEREIALKLKLHNRVLFYRIENPYAPSHLERVRGDLHGYGLKNVRRCVEKYQGTIEVKTEGHVFSVSAHLNV